MALDDQDIAKITELTAAAIVAAQAEADKKTTKIVNAAIASTLKPFKERLESVPDAEAQAAKLKEMVDAATAELAKKLPAAPGGAKPDDETAKALSELKTANETLQARLKKQDEERKAEKAQQAAMEESAAVSAALIKAEGFKKGLLQPALDHIKSRGMIKRDPQGAIAVEVKNEIGGTELVALEDGMAAWLKTDTGKEFLQPKDVGGSGTGAGGRARGGVAVPVLTGAQMAAVFNESGE